jgi:hypothetical protein
LPPPPLPLDVNALELELGVEVGDVDLEDAVVDGGGGVLGITVALMIT